MLSLFPYRRFRPMSRNHSHVVGQAQQFILNPFNQLPAVTSGQIGTPYASGK